VEELRILPLQRLTNCSGKSVYWGFFLSFTGSFGLGASCILNLFEVLMSITDPLVLSPLEELHNFSPAHTLGTEY
jgi:hypothetical protein